MVIVLICGCEGYGCVVLKIVGEAMVGGGRDSFYSRDSLLGRVLFLFLDTILCVAVGRVRWRGVVWVEGRGMGNKFIIIV